MPITGYTATLPADVLMDSGVFYEGATVIGVTRGGISFEPNAEKSNLEFDGKRSDIEGHHRNLKWKPVMKGTMLELNADQIERMEPGVSNAVVTGGVAYTPKPANVLYTAATDYLEDLRCIFERGTAGLYAAIVFPKAIVNKYSIKGVDNDVALIDFEFEAVTTAAAISACPYKIELRTVLPA